MSFQRKPFAAASQVLVSHVTYYFHRAFALDGCDLEEREDYMKEIEELVEKEHISSLNIDYLEGDNPDTGKYREEEEGLEDPFDEEDSNQLVAYGDW